MKLRVKDRYEAGLIFLRILPKSGAIGCKTLTPPSVKKHKNHDIKNIKSHSN